MRARRWIWVVAAIAAIAAVILGAAIVGRQTPDRADVTGSPSPTVPPPALTAVSASPALLATPSPTPSASALPPRTFENPILGYRITLPDGYRRSRSIVITGQQNLGVDLYTQTTEQQEREACLRDLGDLPSPLPPGQDPPIRIGVARNIRSLSAMEWATTPYLPGAQPLSTHQKVEPVTVGGREAVRLVADNATAVTNAFVVRANDRIYEIYPTQGPPSRQTWLDDIAKTFVAIEPAPFPTPTATVAPRVAAREVGAALARAFAAKDADGVGRLMPTCHIGVGYYIDSTPSGGALNRSVVLFIDALRDRFARGDLTVTVDPTVQVKTDLGGEHFFVISNWTEPDRTTRIDFFLDERDGRWQWGLAMHYYRPQDVGVACGTYRSPWVPSDGGRC